jgi:hypothetical protein
MVLTNMALKTSVISPLVKLNKYISGSADLRLSFSSGIYSPIPVEFNVCIRTQVHAGYSCWPTLVPVMVMQVVMVITVPSLVAQSFPRKTLVSLLYT